MKQELKSSYLFRGAALSGILHPNRVHFFSEFWLLTLQLLLAGQLPQFPSFHGYFVFVFLPKGVTVLLLNRISPAAPGGFATA
jgi:hypothetical protein